MEVRPERELKLAAAADFRMPSLYGLGGTTVRQELPERMVTVYYDTADLRLARWGASLRHRPGEGWTVKLPAERDAPFLERAEAVFEGEGGTPPDAAVTLVRGFVRGAELAERVRLTTVRRRSELVGATGDVVGGVVDDSVAVQNGSGPASAFRELEVEIGEQMTPGLLDALVERLRQAGAGTREQTPKYIRALSESAPLPPEIAVSDVGVDSPAGDVLRRALAVSVIRLVRHDSVVRLDVDTEGVHQARVATRRLRSDLRTFRPLLERTRADDLRRELGWLAAALGDVRDADVLLERLRGHAASLPEADRSGADAVLESLDETRRHAYGELRAVVEGERYAELLERLVSTANEPVLSDSACDPARDVVPAFVRRPWRALANEVSSLDAEPTEPDLHQVRIRAKRARYAAEAVAPVVGKPARAFAVAAAGLQGVLGDLNDAAVSAAWLEEWAAGRSTGESRGADALAAIERATAQTLLPRWRAAWEKLAAPDLRAWM